MTSILYKRTFRFSAAHFNSRKTYETYWALETAKEHVAVDHEGQTMVTTLGRVPIADLQAAFLDIHGHNFVVDIEAQGELDEEGFIVSDEDVDKIIKAWDGINLSVLPEFVQGRERATTENMARQLKRKLEARFPNPHFSVRVHETDDIFASA